MKIDELYPKHEEAIYPPPDIPLVKEKKPRKKRWAADNGAIMAVLQNENGAVSPTIQNKTKLFIEKAPDPEGFKEFLVSPKRKYDLIKAVDYKLKGMAISDIYKVCVADEMKNEVSLNAFSISLAKYTPKVDMEELAIFKKTRIMVYTDLEKKLVDKIHDKIENNENIPARDLKDLFNVIYNSRRLEEDKSTSNVATKHTSVIERIYAKRRASSARAPDGQEEPAPSEDDQ